MKSFGITLLYVQGRTNRFVELRNALFLRRREVTIFGSCLRFDRWDDRQLADQMTVTTSRRSEAMVVCWDGDRESALLMALFLLQPMADRLKGDVRVFAHEASDLLAFPLMKLDDVSEIVANHLRLSVA